VGGKYEVVHHTEFLKSLLDDGRLTIEGGQFKGKRITFHDPCYLGRANNVYEAQRLIQKLDAEVEMKRSRANGYAVEQEVLKCLKTQRQVTKI
jgi:Fe-S oxidoreductase